MKKKKVGSVLPNIARCIKAMPANPTPADVETWLNDLKHLATHSHLRGTCLLTAQQAMVDVTSNYKTSLIAYSSVNMLFMLAVILWISASFALFYIGGGPKRKDELDGLKSSEQWENARWSWEDVTTLVGIAWNLMLVAYILYPGTLRESNIPLNNAALGILVLLAAIAVQWHSAYYSSKKFDKLYNLPPAPQAKMDARLGQIQASAPSHFFTTSNFLSAASDHFLQRKNGYDRMMMVGQPFARQYYYEAIKVSIQVFACQNP